MHCSKVVLIFVKCLAWQYISINAGTIDNRNSDCCKRQQERCDKLLKAILNAHLSTDI